MRYWLLKSEPNTYSIDDLQADGSTCWEGVRNYQARNFMRDDMSVGDKVLFYHSNAKPPGVVGLAEITREGYEDHYALDPDSHYFHKRAKPGANPWVMVDVGFVQRFDRVVTLAELKAEPALEGMAVIQKGQRLSVQPVEEAHYRKVVEMAGLKADS